MGICFKKSNFIKSKKNSKPNINIIKQKKNDNADINLNRNKSIIESNENVIEDKYQGKSVLLSIKTKKLNEKYKFGKSQENTYKSLNLKISIKSKYILKKILFNLDEKRKLLLLK